MIKTLAKQIKQYKASSISTVLFAILEVFMEISIPLLMAKIIDDGIAVGNINRVYMYGAIMIVAAGFSLFCGIMAGRLASYATTGFACNLRNAMYEKIQTYSFSNIDKFSTAGLVTRLTTDVTNIQNAYQMILRMCVRAPASLVCAMVMSFIINARIACVFLVVMLFLGCAVFFIITRAMPMFDQVFKKYDDLNASVQENVSAIRVVKSFVREDYENKKFNKAVDMLYGMFVRVEKMITLNQPIMMFSMYSCMIAISWMGAHMINSGSLTTGELTSLFSYVANILMSLMMVSMIFVMITMSLASARRISEVLSEEADIVNPQNPVMEVADGSVKLEHVNFSYKTEGKGEFVLSDINLDIKAGETIGILGSTGSAKSSMVSLISRLYDATEGVVKVGGRDVKEYDLEALRDAVSVVLQKNELFSGTILDNLRWGDKEATKEECIRACQMACADDFIQAMPDGYETYIEQGGTNVSGGQKQRICIARALLKKPKILILDDSTSAVDTATDSRIRKAFREEIPNMTKFIISQRVSSVSDADRIIVMDNGQINGFDTHENLLKSNEIYTSVYESQTQSDGDFDEKGA